MELSDESYIAGFFSNGRMLLGESHESFNATLEASFGQFKAKIVDSALQKGGFHVFSPEHISDETECQEDSWGGAGAQWVDMGDGNTYCMQLYRDAETCGGLTSCNYAVVEVDVHNKLQEKYGFNMLEYYKAAYFCGKDGADDRQVSLCLANCGSFGFADHRLARLGQYAS